MDPMTTIGLANSVLNSGQSAMGGLTGSAPDNGVTRLASIWLLGPALIWFATRDNLPDWSRSALVGAGLVSIFWNATVWNQDELIEQGRRMGWAEARGHATGPVVDTTAQETAPMSTPRPVRVPDKGDEGGPIPFPGRVWGSGGGSGF